MRLDTNLKVFIWYGIVFEIMTKMYDPFLIKFLERVGGGALEFSLYNSIPGFVTIFALIPGAMWMRRLNSKRAIMVLIAMSRICLLLLIAVPFFSKENQPLAFILFYALMQFPTSIYQSSFQAFTGEVFSLSERGRAIGMRNAYTVPFVTITIMVSGWILSSVPHSEAERLVMYQVFFFIAFIWGIFEIYLFNQFKYTYTPIKEPIHFKKIVDTFKNNKPFKGFVICSLIFHFGWQMGWPLFNVYLLKNLHADENWLSIINVATYIAMFFAYKYWTHMIDKKGNAFVCGVCTLGMALSPIWYVLSPNLIIIAGVSVIMGVFMAGTLSVLLNSLLEVCPSEDRLIYIAIYNTLISVSLAISPLIGHAIYMASSIQFAMVVVAVFRLFGSLAFFIRNKQLENNVYKIID